MITDSKVNMSSVMGVASAASEAGSNSNFTSLSQMITDSKLNMSSVMGVASAASEAGSNSNFTSASPRQTSVRSPFFSRNNETEGMWVSSFCSHVSKRQRILMETPIRILNKKAKNLIEIKQRETRLK